MQYIFTYISYDAVVGKAVLPAGGSSHLQGQRIFKDNVILRRCLFGSVVEPSL